MDRAVAWAGGLVVLGCSGWLVWQPPLEPLLLGVVACAGLAVVSPGRRVACLALSVGAWLLGTALPASLPGPPASCEYRGLSGSIGWSAGRWALLRTGAGRFWVVFPDEPPDPGSSVVVWLRDLSPPSVLPGSLDPTNERIGGHTRGCRVRAWIGMGARTTPVGFAGAKHPGLLEALSTGDRSRVPEPVLGLLRDTGTVHLLSISGLHVGMVVGWSWMLVRAVLSPLVLLGAPGWIRGLPLLVAGWVAWDFGEKVGWPVSTRRAAVMVLLGALARTRGRRTSVWNLLGLAAIVVVVAEPSQVYSAGFRLSFSAVIGMLLVGPCLLRWLPPDVCFPVRWVMGSLAATVGATLGTLPTSALLFQHLAPVAPLANLVAVPLLGGVVVPALWLSGLVPGELAWALSWTADGVSGLVLDVLGRLPREPWTPAVGIGGALLLAVALLLRRRPVLATVPVLVALGLRVVPTGRLVVTFLAVGQGDAALVEWPDGRRWLVDGGPSSWHVLHYLRRRGLRRLDAVFVSHPHPDHFTGLETVLDELRVDSLWVPRLPREQETRFLELWTNARSRGVSVKLPGSMSLGTDGEVLHPLRGWTADGASAVNEESLVLRVVHGEHSVLFTGDIEGEAEAFLAPSLPVTTVLKVPHHGSATSSSAALLDAVRPDLAVVSCGPGNRYGHPSPAILSRYRGARLFRTDRDGTIEVSMDGHELKVRSWRA
ncbi:MAG: DNA internalization-related competence protein ComEC/Rec2, partial [Myxococcota bacterium]|nr:DNA internalization-related competence protein ComEC/Rec2 [Myxococcota bacterium]